MAINLEKKSDRRINNPYKHITDVLIMRDRITEKEAIEMVRECRAEIFELLQEGGGYEEVTDVIYNHLGLEPDYIDYMLIY